MSATIDQSLEFLFPHVIYVLMNSSELGHFYLRSQLSSDEEDFNGNSGSKKTNPSISSHSLPLLFSKLSQSRPIYENTALQLIRQHFQVIIFSFGRKSGEQNLQLISINWQFSKGGLFFVCENSAFTCIAFPPCFSFPSSSDFRMASSHFFTPPPSSDILYNNPAVTFSSVSRV